jgi:sulfur-oxidizing protein SoxA
MKLYCLALLFFAQTSVATPLEDQQNIRHFYQQLFPSTPPDNYADGVYAFDEDAYHTWQDINQFPPYEFSLEQGKKLFNTPFKNQKSYADCFTHKGIAIVQNFPFWDDKTQQIITLALAINQCRVDNNETELVYEATEITNLTAYMAYTSRGQRIQTKLPMSALAAYEAGKKYFYQRRGQLNFSCASCHIDNAGKYIRSELLSPALGHTTHWPAYRLKTQQLGSLHTRFKVCNKLIRADIDGAQSTKLRQLEFFLSYMANGLPLNGPSLRK